jgi:hypothetical protein
MGLLPGLVLIVVFLVGLPLLIARFCEVGRGWPD